MGGFRFLQIPDKLTFNSLVKIFAFLALAVGVYLYDSEMLSRPAPTAAAGGTERATAEQAVEVDPSTREFSPSGSMVVETNRSAPNYQYVSTAWPTGEKAAQTAVNEDGEHSLTPPKYSFRHAREGEKPPSSDRPSAVTEKAYEGREAAVLAARSMGRALREFRQGEVASASAATGPGEIFYRQLRSGGQELVAEAAEEIMTLQALKSSGEMTAADEKTTQRNIAAAAADAVVRSGLASAKASGIAPLAHLELELVPADETGWGISASTLIPIWESELKNHTAFSQLSYRREGDEFVTPQGGRSLIADTVASAGFAYRNYREDRDYLWGVNGFFDSDTDNHWRTSVGSDWDWGTFALSTNYYYALTHWKNTVDGFEAKIRDGYDLEARGRLKPLDGAEIGMKAFTWLGEDGADDINGIEISARYQPVSLVGLNGSYSFNSGDLPLWQAGLSFTYMLGIPWSHQVRRLTYAEKVDLRNLRHHKVRRENRLFLQERIKAGDSVSVASLKGLLTVANARGASEVPAGGRFAFPAFLSLSSNAGDTATFAFNDGAALAVGSATPVEVSGSNVTLSGDGFIRYRSGAVSRTLSMPGGVSIRLLGTEVELRQQDGESTVGVLSGSVVISGPGYSVSAKAADIVDVRSGRKLVAFAERLPHINASLAMIDGPNLRSSVWNGGHLDDDNPSSAPVAEGCVCGQPTVEAGSRVTLDGTSSHARSGRTIERYLWRQVGGPPVVLDFAGTALPQFTAPYVKVGELLLFNLTVTDNFGVSNSKVIEVRVEPNFQSKK